MTEEVKNDEAGAINLTVAAKWEVFSSLHCLEDLSGAAGTSADGSSLLDVFESCFYAGLITMIHSAEGAKDSETIHKKQEEYWASYSKAAFVDGVPPDVADIYRYVFNCGANCFANLVREKQGDQTIPNFEGPEAAQFVNGLIKEILEYSSTAFPAKEVPSAD